MSRRRSSFTAPVGSSGGGGGPSSPTWTEITDAEVGSLVDPDGILTSMVYSGGVWTATYAGTALERDGLNEAWPRFEIDPASDLFGSFGFLTHAIMLRIEMVTRIGGAELCGPAMAFVDGSAVGQAIGLVEHTASNYRWVQVSTNSTIVLASTAAFDDLVFLGMGPAGRTAGTIVAHNGAGSYTVDTIGNGGNHGTTASGMELWCGVITDTAVAVTSGSTQQFRYYACAVPLPALPS